MAIVDKTRRPAAEVPPEERARIAAANHIWINAMSTVRPTDEFLIELGRSVLRHVLDSQVGSDFAPSMPVTWIEVNAS